MDLSKYNMAEHAEAGAELIIILPDRTKSDWKIRLRGKDSSDYRRALNKLVKKSMNKSVDDDDEDGSNPTLAACVMSWAGATMDGVDFECNAKNIDLVTSYDKGYKWVAEQIDAFIGDRANFLQGAKNE
jgi:hypothetical protein